MKQRTDGHLLLPVRLLVLLFLVGPISLGPRHGSTLWSAELPAVQVEQAPNDVLAGVEHVREFLKDGQWNDAVETISRTIENHGQTLIATPVSQPAAALGFSKFVPLREYCHREIAAWHFHAPEALRLYRERVDSVARQWYEEAVESRNEQLLQQIVDELFVSSFGDDALLSLGDLALERGNGTLARSAWERISPKLRVPPAVARDLHAVPGSSWWTVLHGKEIASLGDSIAKRLAEDEHAVQWLAYPDSDIPLAAVRARLVLVALLQGDWNRAEMECQLLQLLHPTEQGTLAGREGTYAMLVADLLQESRNWPVLQPADRWRSTEWPTLAGSPARNGIAAPLTDIMLQPAWRAQLPNLRDADDMLTHNHPRVAERAEGLLSYHVAVADNVVYVAQPGMIRALDMATGQPLQSGLAAARDSTDESYGVIYESFRVSRDLFPKRASHAGVPRYSLTLDDHRLFARQGNAWTGDADKFTETDRRTLLIGLDLRTQKLIFDPIQSESAGWEFTSAPLAKEGRLFVGLRKRDPASVQLKVACYSADSGELRWQRTLVRGETYVDAQIEFANSPLTLADDTLYFNTHLGAIAAVRATDGQIKWLCRYPRVGLQRQGFDDNGRHGLRDQTPCLVHRDRVICAPADSNRLFALDATSGQVQWVTAAGVATDLIHLAGVGQQHLLGSGDYLYWLDVHTGRLDFQFPAARTSLAGYASPSPRGHGRPVLSGEQLWWPTHDKIYIFGQHDNRQLRQPINLAVMGVTGGHLVISGNTLLVAGADHLTAFRGWHKVPVKGGGGGPD